jgi:hypothetical protein
LDIVVTVEYISLKVKVFSQFDSLKEATKNYTIEATPDDRPSVLQQVRSFIHAQLLLPPQSELN